MEVITDADTPEVSITIKGQEIPGYDARALQGMGLGYATSPRKIRVAEPSLRCDDLDRRARV